MTALFNRIYLGAWRALQRDEGQTFVEYALVAAVVALGIAVALTAFGTNVAKAFTDISNKLDGLVPK